MLIPLSWLKEYVDLGDQTTKQYVKKMIMAGNAIENVVDLGGEISKVVVGHILKIEKHPDADRLSICQVDVGGETVQIVTGAPNMKEGDYVPTALDGATLPGGVKIKKGKLRGVPSNGMMCSGEELNVPKEVYPSNAERGLLILQGEQTPGADIKPVLGLDETVLDLEVLANRPDCLSMLGVAYESVAAAGGTMQAKEPVAQLGDGNVNDYVQVRIDEPSLCARYCARVVKNIKIEPSPLWMRLRLHAAGIKPINNIVDITNYVMLETGQPMHAFDLDSVRGGQIIVRKASAGESIRTLDGKDRTLTPSMLVIADAKGATGLAGVMGGEGSEIKEETKMVLFESACFARDSVRQTGRALGLRTESQGRFERGVNETLSLRALERAVELVVELGAGEVVQGVIDAYPTKTEQPTIVAPIAYMQTLMGIAVEPKEMLRILETLCITARQEGDALICQPPLHRQDIQGAADIAEEILRIYGYDKIPTTLFKGESTPGQRSKAGIRNGAIRELLTGMGAHEIVTFAFIAPKWYDMLNLPADAPERISAVLQNPISEDYSMMRTTLVPSILNVISTNASRSVETACVFEFGSRYLPKSVPMDELPEERPTLCLGAYGSELDFFSVKGMAEAVFERFGVKDVTWVRADKSYLHPGQGAVAMANGAPLCVLGMVHPDVQTKFDIARPVFVAEFDLRALDAETNAIGDVAGPPKYPAVVRDMALVVGEDVPVGDMLKVAEKAAGKLLETVKLFDIYQGEHIQAGYKSVAISITLRAADRTLTDEEVNGVYNRCLKAMEKEMNAVLRS